MRLRLSAGDRRAVFAGSLFIAATWSIATGVPRLTSWTDERRASAAELRRDMATLQEGLASQRARKARLDTARAVVAAADRRLLQGTTPAGAAATLGQLLADAADSAHLELHSRHALAPQEDSVSGLAVVGVRLEATGDIRNLTDFIAGIEGSPSLLRIRSIAISQLDPAAEMERLRVEATVEALAAAACACTGPRCACRAAGDR